MKIAMCLAGQYRTFDAECVQKGLYEFILNKYDCDVYFSTWSNRGKSVAHGCPVDDYKNINEEITPDHILKYVPNAIVDIEIFENWKQTLIPDIDIDVENYDIWKRNLIDEYSNIIPKLSNTIYSGIFPQMYKKYKAFAMLKKSYDFVIITRPDLLYWDTLEIEECIKYPNTIWNSNPSNNKVCHPLRIYDIFFMGNHEDMEKMSYCYFNMLNLLDDPYGSKFEPLDPCKMLYIFAKKFCQLEVKSISKFISEAYRGEDITKLLNIYSEYANVDKLRKLLDQGKQL